jgi:hypothetical protein
LLGERIKTTKRGTFVLQRRGEHHGTRLFHPANMEKYVYKRALVSFEGSLVSIGGLGYHAMSRGFLLVVTRFLLSWELLR